LPIYGERASNSHQKLKGSLILNFDHENGKGTKLLTSSYFNKGSAFPLHERKEFELEGLLPPNVQTLDEQVKRAYEQYNRRGSDALGKNTFLASMKAQNEVLYYKVDQFL
jgi:malate dehydrogenase (oxaloacetate-decarboxylating)